MKIKNYIRPECLEEAYDLNQKRSNRLVGGMLWMRLGHETIQTAVDLAGLGLDIIEETQEEFRIGCMVTLRQLELCENLNVYTEGSIRRAVNSIVGVQFRNLATVGGSIWGRFGFSDVLTVFLALDTWVELYQGGFLPLAEFAEKKKDNDILVRLIVKKRPQRTAYQFYRNIRTDFPVLTCAVEMGALGGSVTVGARPGRARTWQLPEEVCQWMRGPEKNAEAVADVIQEMVKQIPVGSNLRAGAEYRAHLAEVLIKRGLTEVKGGVLS